MAVIREKRQYKIGPIGVARASQGGQIVGEAVASSANQIAGTLFKVAAGQAEKAGIEAAASTARDAIISIDPSTGKPEAFNPPEGFGGIATEAYQRVVNSRFQQSIDEEIKLKARELAVQFETSTNPVALYETAMSDYIASMSNNAQGSFKQYIADVGTSYLNATRTSLAINKIRNERAEAKKANARAIEEANETLEAIVSANGAASFAGQEGSMTQAEFISESANVAMNDASEAGLINADEVQHMNFKQRMAIARGAIRHVSGTVESSEDLRLIQYAIGSQDISAIPDQYQFLKDALSTIAQTPSSLAQIEKFSDNLLADRVQLVQITEQRAQAEIEAAETARVFDLSQEQVTVDAGARTVAADPKYSSNNVANVASVSYSSATNRARDALLAGNEDESKQIIANRDSKLAATVDGLALRALSGLTPDQATQLEAAVVQGQPSMAPEGTQDVVASLLRLSGSVGPEVIESFTGEIRSFKEGPAKFNQLQDRVAAESVAQSEIMPAINQISLAGVGQAANSLVSVLDQIDQLEGLDPKMAKDMKQEAYYKASLSATSAFFGTNPTEEQMESAMSYIQTGEAGSLTLSQQALLDRAREYNGESGRTANLRTYVNERSSALNEQRNRVEREAQRQEKFANISMGMGNPANAADRGAYSDALETKFDLNGQTLGEILLSGSSESVEIIADIQRTNMLPQELHDAFVSFASGGMMQQFSPVILSHWRNLRTSATASGQQILSPAVEALGADKIAVLDAMSEYGRVFGDSADAMSEAFAPLQRYNSDKLYRESVNSMFGEEEDSLDLFVQSIDGIGNAPASAYQGFRAAAIQLAAIGNKSPAQIKDQLERQIEETYPDGDNVVYGTSMNSRSPAALSRIIPGNERLFMSFVREQVLDSGMIGPDQPATFETFMISPSEDGRVIQSTRSRRSSELFLQPISSPIRGNTDYRVMRFNKDAPLGREVVMREQNGAMIPFIVSTSDPRFVAKVNSFYDAADQQAKDQAESRARRIQEVYEAPVP